MYTQAHWKPFLEPFLCDHWSRICATSQRRRSDFQSGGGGGHQQKRALPGKKGTYKGKSQSENKQFLDIGIYPYNLITLSGMISIFVSLYTSYKILLFKASYLAVGCDGRKNHLRARKNIRFVRSQCENCIL